MQLILVRHSIPVIDTAKPPAQWKLSPAGIEAVSGIASEFEARGIDTIYSSEEPKAAGTARELARLIGCSWETRPGLHEHERNPMKWSGQTEWHALLREFFKRPDELVFGLETANQARERYTMAVERLLSTIEDSTAPLVIVSHGTVMSLFAAQVLGVDPYSIWKDLELPDYVELLFDSSN